jgi:hypothetical protein
MSRAYCSSCTSNLDRGSPVRLGFGSNKDDGVVTEDLDDATVVFDDVRHRVPVHDARAQLHAKGTVASAMLTDYCFSHRLLFGQFIYERGR